MKASLFLTGTIGGTYADIVEQVRLAEDLGFHGVWLGERYFANGDLLWPSTSVAAAYLLASTRRLRIGLAATVLPFHHPLQVAADAASLDVFSGGRFDLGVTSGSMDDVSHQAFGVDRAAAWDRFQESIQIVRLALRGQPFSFSGTHFKIEDLVPSPTPVQAPHFPLYMVANSPRSVEFAADRGIRVFANAMLSVDEIARHIARYAERTAAAGFDPRAAEVPLNRYIFVGESDAHAYRVMREPFLRFLVERATDLRDFLLKKFGADGLDFDFLAQKLCLFCGVEQCIERLQELGERGGVRHVLFTSNLITLEHEVALESMVRLARDVLPRVRRHQAAVGASPATPGEHPRVAAIEGAVAKA